MTEENKTQELVSREPSIFDRMLLGLKREDGSIDIGEMRELMMMKREHEADVAKKAFYDAIAAFSAENIVIFKDALNKQYNSRYTSLGNLVNNVKPYLGKHGLSHAWRQERSPDDPKKLRVFCKLSHRLGHFAEDYFDVPADESGNKNAIQQWKSAVTYARSITFEGVCGLASSNANSDDDGNNAVPKEKEPTPDELAAIERRDALYDKIKLSETLDELMKLKPEIEAETGAARRNLANTFNIRKRELKAGNADA